MIVAKKNLEMHVYTLQVPWHSFNLSKRSVSIYYRSRVPEICPQKSTNF